MGGNHIRENVLVQDLTLILCDPLCVGARPDPDPPRVLVQDLTLIRSLGLTINRNQPFEYLVISKFRWRDSHSITIN